MNEVSRFRLRVCQQTRYRNLLDPFCSKPIDWIDKGAPSRHFLAYFCWMQRHTPIYLPSISTCKFSKQEGQMQLVAFLWTGSDWRPHTSSGLPISTPALTVEVTLCPGCGASRLASCHFLLYCMLGVSVSKCLESNVNAGRLTGGWAQLIPNVTPEQLGNGNLFFWIVWSAPELCLDNEGRL